MVRGRADRVRGGDPVPARLPRARALPLHDRLHRARAAGAAAPARHWRAGQRRLPGHQDRTGHLPARRAGEDLLGHLRGLLLARHAPGARARGAPVHGRDHPAAQALRAAAGHLGRVDAHARPHPRPGLVADVLRRVPGHALRGHQPGLVRARGPDPVRAGRVVPGQPHRPRARPRRDLAGPVPDRALQQARRQLPDRAVPVRRRPTGADRHRLRAGLAQPAQRHADPARRAHRPHLRGDHERARARRRLRRAARLPALHRARVQDRDARARLVLQPAGDRPDRGARAAGLRDRGRSDEGDPADRRDLAVRLLRRLVHRGQLHPARAAAADLDRARRDRA